MALSQTKIPISGSILGLLGLLRKILFGFLLVTSSAAFADCPNLTSYYPGVDADWPALEQRLAVLMPECLESAEFFSLLGGAQLESGNIAESLETLERALLLEPDNAGAQVDYSQALFLQGELFAAIELNRQLLRREDIPVNIQRLLEDRQQTWQALTSQSLVQLDVLAGYDNNLNSAPDPGQITLTLSGEPIVLALNSEFRPQSGPYMNFRLAGRFRQLRPDYQNNWLVEARGRVSEDSESDLLQLDTRYAYVRPGRRQSWQLNASMTHLFFGGNPLYTATETSTRYLPQSSMACKPFLGLALQHQLFHNNSRLNAVEGLASSGFNCPLNTRLGPQLLSVELGLLENREVNNGRPGGDRGGWQFNLNWQFPLGAGEILSQVSHTSLDDKEGYNPLLANGAERWLDRSYVLLQYRRQISSRTALMMNVFHQHQRSNIELFRSVDTTFEVGFSLAL